MANIGTETSVDKPECMPLRLPEMDCKSFSSPSRKKLNPFRVSFNVWMQLDSDPSKAGHRSEAEAIILEPRAHATVLRSLNHSALSRCSRPEAAISSRLLIAIMIAALLLCSAAQAQLPARPATGTFIRDTDRSGYGLLTIHNNWTMDTVAVLTDENAKPLVAVYLRSKETLNITGIKDGSYGLYFTVGNLWDAKAGKFKSVLGYYRYNAPLIFVTTDNGDSIEYSVFELDLYEAGASNFLPDVFQFPDLGS